MKNVEKILLVSMNGFSNAGGVEKVSYYLNELLSQKYETKVVTKTKLNFGKLNNLLQPILISLKLKFCKYTRKSLIIANSWHCFLFPADISVHHGTSAGIMLKTGEVNMSLKITAWMEKVSAKKANHILSVSENCKKELIEYYGIDEKKITVINNFVQDDVFTPEGEYDKNDKNGIINVCFSGALISKKGMEKLNEFSKYIEENKFKIPLHLNIATNYERNAEDFKNRKNTTIRTGLTSTQMPDFYRENDVMFFPTKYEGFSMAVLEALSSGLCLTGTDFAVTPEVIKYDFCHHIEQDTPMSEIAAAIIKLAEKYRGRKKEIHEIIKKDFGTEQYKKKIFDFVEERITSRK
ncbi:MAG: glycosyltransferase family 4 protein [Treponema sp.]|nr:glycosyltransferase family 4 protein [Treponema sp.]